MTLDRQPPAPGPQVLLAFMKFLQQACSLIYFFHCISKDSCFEISSIIVKFCFNLLFNFVPPTLSHFLIKERLIKKTELIARETFVNKILNSVDP